MKMPVVRGQRFSGRLLWYRWRRRDLITGLPGNRDLQSDLASALQNSRQVAYILADLDEFKKVNDTYGHPAGDKVLHAVARAFAAQCRGNRHRVGPYRQGGESFSILLTGVDAESAAKFAESLRASVEGIRIDGCLDLKITARFAVVTAMLLETDGGKFKWYREQLQIKAHQALYCHPNDKKYNAIVHIECPPPV
jgi:diguanylate cyclase (GGDEF)-like protein